MKKDMQYKIGFADAEILGYLRDQSTMIVHLKLWNEETLSIIFTDVIGIEECGIGDISNLVQESEPSHFFSQAILCQYEQAPHQHPYKLFQFLNLDDNPCLQIVAESLEMKPSILEER